MDDILTEEPIETITPVWHEKLFIRHSEGDCTGNLKLRTLSDYLQEAAANHAAHLGVGLSDLSENNMLWVLSRIKIQVDRMPRIGECLTIRTWPSGFDKLFATRQFTVYDEVRRIVCRASSAWLLLDAEKFRPLHSKSLPVGLPLNADQTKHFEAIEKIKPHDTKPGFTITVRHSAVDVNGHLNNAEYSGYIHDFLVAETGAAVNVSNLSLNFLSDMKEGEEMDISGSISENSFFVQGTNSEGKTVFMAEGKLA
ncbi:MAG: hypothetical protein GY750_12285 [Lentisphaerae bacterium]|nr:hypothetical protein [Lentisphaerota bacterium]MCP4102192.1 hypothetical protein [Lentisphaerota bacterium]